MALVAWAVLNADGNSKSGTIPFEEPRTVFVSCFLQTYQANTTGDGNSASVQITGYSYRYYQPDGSYYTVEVPGVSLAQQQIDNCLSVTMTLTASKGVSATAVGIAIPD